MKVYEDPFLYPIIRQYFGEIYKIYRPFVLCTEEYKKNDEKREEIIWKYFEKFTDLQNREYIGPDYITLPREELFEKFKENGPKYIYNRWDIWYQYHYLDIISLIYVFLMKSVHHCYLSFYYLQHLEELEKIINRKCGILKDIEAYIEEGETYKVTNIEILKNGDYKIHRKKIK